MKLIAESLGMNHVKDNETTREYWTRENLEIVFMDFLKPQKLEILEVEGANKEAVEGLVQELGDLVQVAGEEVFKSFD